MMAREEALYKVKGYLTNIIPIEDYSEVEEIIEALKQVNMLQDIKKEIELKEKTLTDKYGQTKYGVWTDDVCNVFDKYIEKYSNT